MITFTLPAPLHLGTATVSAVNTLVNGLASAE
ncbi:hypothetical protein SAMN05444695_101544 [Rhodococcus triatomae]|uniref:Uncharacterized protein n=1 Tax=Rhodococcus triatomae TaxID=300028 RepID=A0A1G8AUD9_9NOCA|nr:hypothetical protein SAMN05444695_101544 [Rhodococcus triatomae]